jgi:hypothetical protein
VQKNNGVQGSLSVKSKDGGHREGVRTARTPALCPVGQRSIYVRESRDATKLNAMQSNDDKASLSGVSLRVSLH